MSRSEDYLDQLLKGVSPEDQGKTELEQDTLDDNIFSNILEEFAEETSEVIEMDELDLQEEISVEDVSEDEDFFSEEDIFGDDLLDEDFLREFELEMEKLEESEEAGGEEDVLSLFDDLDSILNGTQEQMGAEENVPEAAKEPEAEKEPEAAKEPEASVWVEPETVEVPEKAEPEVPDVEEGFSFADLFAEDGVDSSEAAPQEDADVLKILEGLEGIDLELDEEDGGLPAGEQQDFSALEGFLAASAADTQSESGEVDLASLDFGESSEGNADTGEQKPVKKEKKAGEKTGFMSKLSLILFGEDDDEEEEDLKGKKKKGKASGSAEQGETMPGEGSGADENIFGDYEAELASIPEKAPEKGKKEKKKKEKKEKVKKEKVKKEKKPRPKKEKKPKPPKEPDNTPPLPKKPVFLIFLMVGSFIALVILGADLLGYTNQMENAKNQYAKKNYSEAFAEISGIEVKEEDAALYGKYHVMAMVSAELEAYESLMNYKFYDMALDCLVRTVGRAEKYRADAESYGCIQELNELESKAEEILNETFGVSKEEALEFYTYTSKKEYSTAIANVIKELGLEKVTE